VTFGDSILKFYSALKIPGSLKKPLDILLPFSSEEIKMINEKFYSKYFNDNDRRIFVIGINPGRFGGGITGIPFTDPVNLEDMLGIKNDLYKKHELSSQFVYSVINELGGSYNFFSQFYLTAVSPVGFIYDGKNVNYYDIKELRSGWKTFFHDCLKKQMNAGGNDNIAFVLGIGQNQKYFNDLNAQGKYFTKIVPLPHPRWVMQYMYRDRNRYVRLYVDQLAQSARL
jgi:hypothetical protein